jgi:hypothetical protein
MGKNPSLELSKSNTSVQCDSNKLVSTLVENEIISYPRMELTLNNVKSENIASDKIIITPNSINGNFKKLGEKFYFGRSGNKFKGKFLSVNAPFTSKASNTTLSSYGSIQNDYEFNDERIGPRQFDITYNKDKNNFYVTDNRKGSGLFVKIKKSVRIVQDIIASFCAVHMILQVENERKIIIIIFSKYRE